MLLKLLTYYQEEDFISFLQKLINKKEVDREEKAIIERMLQAGYEKLTDDQKKEFDEAVEHHTVHHCVNCGMEIPWGEMAEAISHDGYCRYCQNLKE